MIIVMTLVLSLRTIAEGNSPPRGLTLMNPQQETDGMWISTDNVVVDQVFQELFRGPCKCCGDPSHGVFEQLTGRGGKPRVTLACSVLQEEDWETALRSGLRSMRFKADYGKFADLTRLHLAMRNFVTHGEGRHMHYLELVDFDSDLHRYRHAMHGQHRFKREVLTGSETSTPEELSDQRDL